jgi:Glycosyl hydrolases family 43
LWFAARVRDSTEQCIGVATSRSVLGPYASTASAPVVCQSSLGGSIDPSVIVGTGSRRYLLWKNDGNCCGVTSQIWSQPLATDGTTLEGAPTVLLTYSGGWESGIAPIESTIEGPSMLAVAGHLFLFFSGGGYGTSGYAMGVATCASPLGPCVTQSQYPALSSRPGVAGPGGGAVFLDRYGRPWLAYSAWTPPRIGYDEGGERSLRIDRLSVLGDQVFVLGPTTSTQRVAPPST